ncbi:MAG: calcium/sodium antiporter, partial [Gammaproteobacteria bacterium]|nr:calcium/sodium antiporter [Gammaproteobacteria bacterium]
MVILLFVAGLVLLIVGADALVRGGSRLAAVLGISPLVVGLTVVAFGTSSPELAISINAVISGQGDIALGNVIGSNIFNVLFILGVSALIAPLVVSQQLIRMDVPLMIAVSLLVLVLGLDGRLTRADGLLLFAGLVIYIGFLTHQSRKQAAQVQDEYTKEFGVGANVSKDWFRNAVSILGGLALLVLGSRWLVDSAVSLAQYLGINELVIGLTIIAAGTSLPEVVTSVIASIRGEREIAV